jgi:hypothetical protein
MFSVIIKNKDSNEISRLVKELKDSGLTVGVDFDFMYSTGKYDWEMQTEIPRQTEFVFYNEQVGLIFSLKYLD